MTHETSLCPVCGVAIYPCEGKKCDDKDCPIAIDLDERDRKEEETKRGIGLPQKEEK